ncbi:MAG TPA: glycosyltransferase family A protein [Novosphingobium sp.]|nr:glycosyltransferase family A protein [Novosphingobium sp.]
MVLVDVVMPVFNTEATIASSVRSILEQTIADLRLIVVDDGSTDHTPKILRELASADRRLIVVTTANRGVVDALNTGLEHCRAKYMARHDGDDIAFPDRLARQVAYLDKHSDCTAVSCTAWHIDAQGRRIGTTGSGGDAVGNPHAVPAGEPYLMHPFLLARLDAVRAVGGYRHVLHAEDSDLYWRLEAIGRLHVLDERLGEYRIHAGGVTSGSAQNVRATAVFSQLAALSARRRALAAADIAFSPSLAREVRESPSLARMIELASEGLDDGERRYLEVAAAAKMLQLRVYRRFRFSLADLQTMAKLLSRHFALIPPRDRKILLTTPFWYFYKPRACLNWVASAFTAG